MAFTKRVGAGIFGGEGFILQRLEGEGLAFVHAGGTIVEKNLASGETLRVDTGCLVAFAPTVDYDIKFIGGFQNALFGGEGLFLVNLTGPGLVYLQSLPFSRLADRILAAAIEQAGGHDDHGIIWPVSIAPYQVLITTIKYQGRVRQVAEQLADDLDHRGFDVLIDDRDERPGVKFNDADLIGIPLRITIGDKSLKEDNVEIKPRKDDQPELVRVDQAVSRAVELIKSL